VRDPGRGGHAARGLRGQLAAERVPAELGARLHPRVFDVCAEVRAAAGRAQQRRQHAADPHRRPGRQLPESAVSGGGRAPC
jgi:hypothetical protein